MRRFLFLILLLTVAACGSDDNADNGDTSEETSITPTSEATSGFSFSISGDLEMQQRGETVRAIDSPIDEYALRLVPVGATVINVTLYFPTDVEAGSYDIAPFEEENPTQGRIAATFANQQVNTYLATTGTLTIDSIDEESISGSFSFTATHTISDRRVVEVTGEFTNLNLAGN